MAMTQSFSLNTRKGPVNFTTDLTWQEALAKAALAGANGNTFAADLVAKRDRLSSVQKAWVYKIAEDMASERPSKVTDCSELFASLIEAKVNGLKKPAIRLQGPNSEEVVVKYMSSGKMKGGCWVVANSQVVGAIDEDGEFRSTRRDGVEWVHELLVNVNADVLGSLCAYGKATAQCSCCGLPLTNELSVMLGIGPICRGKFGLV